MRRFGGKGGLQFRIPTDLDLDGVAKAEAYIKEKLESFENNNILPEEERFDGYADRCIAYGLNKSLDYFNPRQLLTLVTYVEIINMACWDDLRPEVTNLVEQRAPEFEENEITGIDLYLSAFGSALNVFSRSYPILDSSGESVRPEVAFAEARKAIANYRFRKLVQTDTAGFDPLTQWYLLAWDAFKAREFPFDEARQLALAVGGFDVNDLAKVYKLQAQGNARQDNKSFQTLFL